MKLPVLSDEKLLDTIQLTTFRYFWDGAEPVSGMARERINVDDFYPEGDKNVVTSGGTGFGLMAILTGIERKFISHEEGIARIDKITRYLEKADRFHGAWPHWLEGETGKTRPFSPDDDGADIVETAYLVQGLITVKQYLDQNKPAEKEIYDRTINLINSVEWKWFQKDGEEVLYWHWSPKHDWKIRFPIKGYNECLIAYIIGASSPTFPLTAESYHKGWARDGKIISDKVRYGFPMNFVHGGNPDYIGSLFWSHYSFLGLDPRGLSDKYADYWIMNQNQVHINQAYCVENPNHFKGYGPDCWGLSASYSVGDWDKDPATRSDPANRSRMAYNAHSPSSDDGVISPTAALSSLPYDPAICMKAARFFYDSLGYKLLGPYGFYDAFSLEYDWFPQKYLAIDQGPVIVMIENYRSGLLWNLFMKDPDVQAGLTKLGFTYKKGI
jgi:hypothetical protein